MIKLWVREQNVPIKSFLIELLVADFMSRYENAYRDYHWYDWFVRDFFRFMQTRIGGQATIPGTGEVISLGMEWSSKTDAASRVAETACDWEYHDYHVTAGQEWQKIFGNRMPINVL